MAIMKKTSFATWQKFGKFGADLPPQNGRKRENKLGSFILDSIWKFSANRRPDWM